jgi:hypothetical protein
VNQSRPRSLADKSVRCLAPRLHAKNGTTLPPLRRSFRPPLKSSGIATNKKISGAHEITFGRMARL